jgi:23S rRNA (guanosine2251-2'-O)-methyltransferase
MEGRVAPTTGSGIWLYGLHAVGAALANPARRLRRLLLTEEAEKALATATTVPWRIAPERVDRQHFASFLPEDAVHQGAALLVEPLASLPLDRALDHSEGPVLVLDQVTDPRNVGAILRSAAAFGAAALVMQDRHAPPETGSLARAASGALELVPVVRVVNLSRALEELKEAGCWVVGLAADAPVTLAQVQRGLSGRRCALVLGAEGEGMRRLTREHCDELARLPISARMESLNVSAAAAVALYELVRET